MSYNTVLFGIEDGVATLTFNRPDRLNALNAEMFREIAAVFDHVRENPDVRALMLTGRGRAFIAGADIKELSESDALKARQITTIGQEVASKVEQIPIPVLAAVNGFALGGGLEMAMACDIIYASEEAKFGQPEINLGLIPGFGATQRLPRLVGLGLAKDLCFTGRTIDAAEARAIGLVARVFPAADLMKECLKVARIMAQKGRFAMQTMKQVMDRGFGVDLRSGLALEAGAFALCFAHPDAKEGTTAFLEKRQPKFL
ncbi:MAG: enoyl-CoA hydratase-related protein [Deltaproteobacteria bacterium]|nr:enoyl-CoA hydratase-related protein [Deltaproteobacteria bacterium]